LLPPDFFIGDINGDYTINISDVTALVNYILCISDTPINATNADINGDGDVNILDLTGLVNIVLGI
jgi:hypothetical protein